MCSGFQIVLRKKLLKAGILFLLLNFPAEVFAQHTMPVYSDVPLPHDTLVEATRQHSGVKPYVDLDVYSVIRHVTMHSDGRKEDEAYSPRLSWKTYYGQGAFNYHNATDTRKAAFLIRPVYDFQFGYDLKKDRALYTTAGGAVLDFDYKQKLGLELRFASGTSVLPDYLDSIARFSGTMPGWGDRAYALDANGKYAFQHFSGNLIYRPSKIFNLQVGRDKHFWGDGYRSLFLSDVGAPFEYVKQQTTIWKLQYTSLFAWLHDWTNSPDRVSKNFRSKFATFHYISFNAAKWLNIGVFESVIWQGTDDNRVRGFDPNYLNPLVFFRPVEYSLGSSDNAMLGFSFKVRFNRNNQLYAQLFLDEFYLKEIKNWSEGWWANKQGIQLGYKCFNFGSVERLFMQAELNIVRPYTYSHGSPQQNYANGGMPLAHPLGANFAEMIGILSYNVKGFSFTGKLVGARYGLDQAGQNLGQDIFKSYITRTSMVPGNPDYNHQLFDGLATNMFYAELRTSYRFNTAFPLRIELLAGARSERNVLATKKSSYIQLGLSLPLWRTYRDF